MQHAHVSQEDGKGEGIRQLTKLRLLNGPCDPREVEVAVAVDASVVHIRPMPFGCVDIYVISDRFIDGGELLVATGEYLYTDGPRGQRDAYRKALVRVGAGRAFRIKKDTSHVH